MNVFKFKNVPSTLLVVYVNRSSQQSLKTLFIRPKKSLKAFAINCKYSRGEVF